MRLTITTIFISLFIWQCAPADPSTSVGRDGWLSGTADEKFETVTNHFGGFARAMLEVNTRYIEMYWAGEDENWDYAAYQLEEMEEALEDGLQRRPARAQSAQHFMSVVIPEMEEAIQARNKELFDQAFELFTLQCNSCHTLEEVSFIAVRPPEIRTGSVRLH